MTTTNATTTAVATGHDDLGTGDPGLLLLPGWCGDRTLFAPLLEPLSAHRRVVAADLRGQGGNTHQHGDFDSAAQADDLVALVDRLGLDYVVPVAVSHAGWFAIELRHRLGADRVPGIVLVDWMPLGSPPGFVDALHGLQDPEAWEQVRGGLFGMWTTGVDNADVLDYVASMGEYGASHWARAGREIAASFEREGTPLAALDRLDRPCPTLHLYAQPADDGYRAAQEEAAAERPWFRVGRLEAKSHFPMFEVPGVMAAEIEEFVCALR